MLLSYTQLSTIQTKSINTSIYQLHTIILTSLSRNEAVHPNLLIAHKVRVKVHE